MDIDPFDLGSKQTVVAIGRQQPLRDNDRRNRPWVHFSDPARWARVDRLEIRRFGETFGGGYGLRSVELTVAVGPATYELQSAGEITFDTRRATFAVIAGDFYVTSCSLAAPW